MTSAPSTGPTSLENLSYNNLFEKIKKQTTLETRVSALKGLADTSGSKGIELLSVVLRKTNDPAAKDIAKTIQQLPVFNSLSHRVRLNILHAATTNKKEFIRAAIKDFFSTTAENLQNFGLDIVGKQNALIDLAINSETNKATFDKKIADFNKTVKIFPKISEKTRDFFWDKIYLPLTGGKTPSPAPAPQQVVEQQQDTLQIEPEQKTAPEKEESPATTTTTTTPPPELVDKTLQKPEAATIAKEPEVASESSTVKDQKANQITANIYVALLEKEKTPSSYAWDKGTLGEQCFALKKYIHQTGINGTDFREPKTRKAVVKNFKEKVYDKTTKKQQTEILDYLKKGEGWSKITKGEDGMTKLFNILK